MSNDLEKRQAGIEVTEEMRREGARVFSQWDWSDDYCADDYAELVFRRMLALCPSDKP